MKTLKLKKDELKMLQEYFDEIHGIPHLLSDLAKRRGCIEREANEIITKANKSKAKAIVSFEDNGKIKEVKIED